MKSWARWYLLILSLFFIFMIPLAIIQISIDPFGVWGSKFRKGINNMKAGQPEMSRIFKPYQYADRKPDIVFFGTSRVHWGLPSLWPNNDFTNIYNFGVNGIHVPEEILTIKHLVKIHKPKIVLIGIDLNQFSVADAKPRPGFSEKRLDALQFGKIFSVSCALSETVFNFDAMLKSFETIKDSRAFPTEKYYQDGFFRWKGERRPDPRHTNRDYLDNMWIYNKIYRGIRLNLRYVRNFIRMVEYLEALKIKVVVFVVPYSADFLLQMRATGGYGRLERMKYEFAKKIPLLDFAYINKETTNRYNYIDGAHFRKDLGLKLLHRIAADIDKIQIENKSFGIWLNKSNAKSRLIAIRKDVDKWKKQNKHLYALLSKRHKKEEESKFTRHLGHIIRRQDQHSAL